MALYFAGDRNYRGMAEKELAELYLAEDRRNEALEIFGQFVSRHPTDSKFHVYGLAGQYVMMVLDGEEQSAFQIFESLWPRRKKLAPFAPEITRRVYLHARGYNPAITPQMRIEMTRWLKKQRAAANKSEDRSGGS